MILHLESVCLRPTSECENLPTGCPVRDGQDAFIHVDPVMPTSILNYAHLTTEQEWGVGQDVLLARRGDSS